jgi:predicted phage tail protein
LARLGSYVESVAGTDDTLITAAGMKVKGSRTPATVPTTPRGVAATAGEHEGEIVLSWKPVPSAYSYVIESSLDPATASNWAHVGIATSATKTIGSLTTGKRYWFRIRAIGPAGESGWSEHATKVVP